MDTLRLEQLDITNFRCFGKCEVRLHPKLTVFVAENGRGKTALLDAISLALGPVVDELTGSDEWSGVGASDVRIVPDETGTMKPSGRLVLGARGVVDGERLDWGVRRVSSLRRGRTSISGLGPLRNRTQAMRTRLDHFAHQAREFPPDQRQLDLPVVLPHLGMLPGCLTGFAPGTMPEHQAPGLPAAPLLDPPLQGSQLPG
jgi:hypothetical protein